MTTIELRINCTAGQNTREHPRTRFEYIKESFQNLRELQAYLGLRYGKIPKGRRKIHRNRKDVNGNNVSETIGFTHSFWNQDYNHPSEKWYQTDWIEIWEEETIRHYDLILKQLNKTEKS